jgi:hypothetical protein
MRILIGGKLVLERYLFTWTWWMTHLEQNTCSHKNVSQHPSSFLAKTKTGSQSDLSQYSDTYLFFLFQTFTQKDDSEFNNARQSTLKSSRFRSQQNERRKQKSKTKNITENKSGMKGK